MAQPERPTIVAGPPRDLRVAIGIDFGTRYTKMAYNALGHGVRRLVRSPNGNPLFVSRLFLDGRERVWLGPAPAGDANPRREIGYLKMLACSPALGGVLGLEDLVRQDSAPVDALAAFYLSWMVRWARRVVMQAEQVQARGDKVTWLTCLSVPAEFCDGPTQDKFRRIADVAHRWAYEGLAEGLTWSDLTNRFRQLSEGRVNFTVAVIPEIVAGLRHMIDDPATPNGIHGFVDIGGGTVDGAIFRILDNAGRREVNVLSASVARLGSAIVSHRALHDAHARAERQLMGEDKDNPAIRLDFDGNRGELLGYANQLLHAAALRCYGHALHDDPIGATDRDLPPGGRPRFRIDVTGGGAHSGWYLDTIAAAERNANAAKYNAMQFEIGCIATPPGYDEHGSPFERFTVAWNLASDPVALEGLKARLPSDLGPAGMPAERPFEPIDHRAIS